MMNEKLDWTQKLGDAFLAQQKDVLATVQTLRQKAQAQGTLKNPKEQKVVTDAGEQHDRHQDRADQPRGRLRADVQPDGRLRRWPYPAYPPYYYYPPGYVAGGALLASPRAWSSAARCGATATGAAATSTSTSTATTTSTTNISNGNWNHNVNTAAASVSRQGVAQQYGRGQRATRRRARIPRPRGAGRLDPARRRERDAANRGRCRRRATVQGGQRDMAAAVRTTRQRAAQAAGRSNTAIAARCVGFRHARRRRRRATTAIAAARA